MTLRLRKIQRDNTNVLLVVHDRTGASHSTIEALTLLLKDILEDNPRCHQYLSEVSPQPQELEDESDRSTDTTSEQDS